MASMVFQWHLRAFKFDFCEFFIEQCTHIVHSYFFYIRTLNFGADAERSYIFLQCKAENSLEQNFEGTYYSVATAKTRREVRAGLS